MSSSYVGLSGKHNVGKFKSKTRYPDYGSLLFSGHIRGLHYFWIGAVRLSARKVHCCPVPLFPGRDFDNLGPEAARGCQKAAIRRTFALPRRLDQEICPGCHFQPEVEFLFSLRRAFLAGQSTMCRWDVVAIIGAISGQGSASSGLFYLLIYNLGIALPVLILGGIIALGMSPEQVDQFRQKHRIGIRLITGIT